MSEENSTAEETTPKKRGRQAGAAAPKQKRNDYQSQLQDLTTRVEFALTLLRKFSEKRDDAIDLSLVEIAIETLDK